MTEPPPLVLAISTANDSLHVGDRGTVLLHVTAEQPDENDPSLPVDWEFFDAEGRPLVVRDDGSGPALEPVDPSASPGRAQQQVLVSRVDLVLANAQVRLDTRIAEDEAAGETVEPGDRLRMVRVQGEFGDVLRMLAALDPALDPSPSAPNPGNWFHNLWHGAFG